jgi:hypothetical protein
MSMFPHAAAAMATVPASLPVDLKYRDGTRISYWNYKLWVGCLGCSVTDLGTCRVFPTAAKRMAKLKKICSALGLLLSVVAV